MPIKDHDRIQKTWVPEGTSEYLDFKSITGENPWLSDYLRRDFSLGPSDRVLDVGGRKGDISFALQRPETVDIVDPDPTIDIQPPPGLFWNCRIQDVDLSFNKYALILCSHVLGYLDKDNNQEKVVNALLSHLSPGGALVLFYNRNTGYMGNLLRYSRKHLPDGHYDYFDERILRRLKKNEYAVIRHDVLFQAHYPDFPALARCCWFLFGALDPAIEKTAAKFLPKLKKDLRAPVFPVEERVLVIRRKNTLDLRP